MTATSQFDTIHSPPNTGVNKPATKKFSDWFESGKDSNTSAPRGKPPSRDRNSLRHGITNPRNADVNGDGSHNGLGPSHPYAAKPVMVRTRGPSPRGRRIRMGPNSDTVSMASIHSEPSAGVHDLTKVNFSPHLARKQYKVKPMASVENIPQAAPLQTSSRNRPPAFENIPRGHSPQRSLRKIRSQSEDPPEHRAKISTSKSPSNKGPRRLESIETPPKGSRHLSLSFGVLDFEQNRIGPITFDNKPKSNNIKGATTDWSLTKQDSIGASAPRSNASSGINVKDSRFLEPIPPLQRSHTFDYGDRKSRKEPPSWQSKTTVNSAGVRYDRNPKPPSSEGPRPRGRPSPKLGQRNKTRTPQNREERILSQQVKSDEPIKKAVTPSMYRHAHYMYKMDKIASEASMEPQPQSPPKTAMDPKHDPIAKFASQFASNMPPSNTRMSETSSLKDFGLGQEMYTIAERSLENSRPTSAAGSTNSLEFLTSASMMNGVLYPQYAHDILAMQDFPGRDQAPKKSILKKNCLRSTASMYEFNRSLNLHNHSEDLTQPATGKIADDQSSVQSIMTFTTDKKKVTWTF